MSDMTPAQVDSWAPMLPAVGELANKIANTNFVPKALRGKPAETAACVLAGRELGVGPMESLQKIHVIDGKPSLAAELMRSLVFRAGHTMRFTALTDEKVTVEGQRRGEDTWTSVTWTMKDAQRIGVTGKDVWKKYPRAMLSNRATAELCRLVFPDALGGFSYLPDEVEDFADTPLDVKAPATKKMSRAKSVETVGDEPAFDDIVDAEIVEPASQISLDMVRDVMREAGVKTAKAFHDEASAVLGRDVSTAADLADWEAAVLFDVYESTISHDE